MYVREFQELLLEIQNMGEEDPLFAFVDSLSGWAKTEFERRGVQDLASIVAAIKSLTEYKRDRQKDKARTTMMVVTVTEIGTSHLDGTSQQPSRTREETTRTRHLGSTHASCTTGLVGFWSA